MKKKNGNGKEKQLIVRNGKLEIGTVAADKICNDLIADFKSGLDFMVLIKGKKPTLLIPGADKLTFKFNLMAQFSKDTEILEMLNTKGLIALKCELISRVSGKKIGEGRGAAVIGEGGNCKDANSTIKMAEIRAKRDAVLNIFPIRDRFTQDIEDANPKETKLSVGSDGVLEI